MTSNSDARKTLKELVDNIKRIFQKHSRSARSEAWSALTTQEGEKEIKKLIQDPNRVVNSTSKWLNFKDKKKK